MTKRGELSMTIEKVKELHLKSCARTLVIEVGEEGIFSVLQHRRAIDSAGQPFGEACLADADRPFDSDIAKGHARRSI